MILDVPYQSQIPLENSEVKKWCGLASLWMVMAFYKNDQIPEAKTLVEKYGSEFEQGGFQHKDLLKIARDYGFKGYRKSWWAEPGVQALKEKFESEGESEEEINEWMSTNIDEGIFTIKSYIEKGVPVIVSVSKEFSPSESTHLVVIIGHEDNDFIIHDPFKRGEGYRISVEEFKNLWIRQAIIIYN